MNAPRHHRRSAQSGQAIVLMALAMVGLLAFVVLAIDGGRFYSQRRQSQNASDMAALAGLYKFATMLNPTNYQSTVTDAQAMREIIRVAQINQIADTDAIPNNNINANVQAFWIDKDGGILRPIVGSGTNSGQFPPAKTVAVKVTTTIPYATFIGGLVGQPNLTAQSDSVARLTLQFKRFTDDDKSVWVGGSDCDNLTNKIAQKWANTNSAKFLNGVYIDGSLAIGSVNSPQFYGDIIVRTKVGETVTNGVLAPDGPYDKPVSSLHPGPFSANTAYFNGATWYGPQNTIAAPKGFPDWANITVNNVKTKIDANSFKPGSGYFYNQYSMAYSAGILPAPWNTIPVDTFYNTIAGSTDGTVTLANVKKAYSDGKRGIYWIDGNLTIPNGGAGAWEGVTFILTGRFSNADNNVEFYSAGKMALNISVLAGADLAVKDANTGQVTDMSPRCASDKANAVFQITGMNNQFHGLIYVPYGQSYFEGETSGGNNAPAFSQGVITYSVGLGAVQKGANSWQFALDKNALVQPIPSTELTN